MRARGWNEQERTAREAVARRLSAVWEEGSGPGDTWLLTEGERVAVAIRRLETRGTEPKRPTAPRLRFDRVATELMETLQDSCEEIVPAGSTVLLAIAAPIRLPGKTAGALTEKIAELVARGGASAEACDEVQGNAVALRVWRSRWARAPRLVAFVHTPDPNSQVLFECARELVEAVRASGGGTAQRTNTRWLLVVSRDGRRWLEVYRWIYAQLEWTAFDRALMVFGDGDVGVLGE